MDIFKHFLKLKLFKLIDLYHNRLSFYFRNVSKFVVHNHPKILNILNSFIVNDLIFYLIDEVIMKWDFCMVEDSCDIRQVLKYLNIHYSYKNYLIY